MPSGQYAKPTAQPIDPEAVAATTTTDAPAAYAPVEPGMYEEPYVAPEQYIAPAATSQTDASTGGGDYAAPPPPPAPIYQGGLASTGSAHMMSTPGGFQHGSLGTAAGATRAGGGGGPASGLMMDPWEIAPPAYAPVEPGMYSPVYGAPTPNYPDTLPPIAPVEGGAPTYPPVEPGMYSAQAPLPYVAPPLEPGVYEPTYTRPGEYAPRASASTYYGGPVDVPYHNGAFNPQRQMAPWGQPGMNRVETRSPASGAPSTYRIVPALGEATVLQAGTSPYPEDQVMPGATDRGDILGSMGGGMGSAPPQPLATLGSTAPEMGYRYQQGDPGVVARPRADGDQLQDVRRSDLSVPMRDLLKGLFGGGEQVSSQEMPLPPGTRRHYASRRD